MPVGHLKQSCGGFIILILFLCVCMQSRDAHQHEPLPAYTAGKPEQQLDSTASVKMVSLRSACAALAQSRTVHSDDAVFRQCRRRSSDRQPGRAVFTRASTDGRNSALLQADGCSNVLAAAHAEPTGASSGDGDAPEDGPKNKLQGTIMRRVQRMTPVPSTLYGFPEPCLRPAGR